LLSRLRPLEPPEHDFAHAGWLSSKRVAEQILVVQIETFDAVHNAPQHARPVVVRKPFKDAEQHGQCAIRNTRLPQFTEKVGERQLDAVRRAECFDVAEDVINGSRHGFAGFFFPLLQAVLGMGSQRAMSTASPEQSIRRAITGSEKCWQASTVGR
jgi:hypothetical protein